jgi:hypothetical protein
MLEQVGVKSGREGVAQSWILRFMTDEVLTQPDTSFPV